MRTKPNVWDEAKKLKLIRIEEVFGGKVKYATLERGVNFFVAMLNQLGCKTYWSCEGHPGGFYIVFRGPYETALKIRKCGYFAVELEHEVNLWSLRINNHVDRSPSGERNRMRYAAADWERRLGKLDFSKIMIREVECAPLSIRRSREDQRHGPGSKPLDLGRAEPHHIPRRKRRDRRKALQTT
jgi:hypothetical protein